MTASADDVLVHLIKLKGHLTYDRVLGTVNLYPKRSPGKGPYPSYDTVALEHFISLRDEKLIQLVGGREDHQYVIAEAGVTRVTNGR